MLDYEIESGEDRARRGMRMKSGVYWHEYICIIRQRSRFSLWRQFPNFMRSLTFWRLFELSGNHGRLVIANRFNGTYTCVDHVENVSFFPFFSFSFFLNCPTIGISSARTNNYLIACLNYAFCHEDRYRGNWTWKLFGKKGKRGVNLERIKFTRARKKEGDEKIK